MRDEKDTKERLDDFSDYMRQRLEGHRLPIEDCCWEEVEARMKRKPLPEGWWWAGSLVAAAILVLVVWLLPVPEEMPIKETILSEKRMGDKDGKIARPAETVRPAEKTGILVEKTIRARQLTARATVFDPVLLESVRDVMIEDNPDVEIAVVPVTVKKSGATVVTPEGYQKYKTEKPDVEKAKRKDRKQGKWQLAASVGAGGYAARPLGGNSDDFFADEQPPSNDPNDPNKPNDPNGGGTNNGGDDDKKEEKGNPVSGSAPSLLRSSSLRSLTDDFSAFDHSFESYPEVSYSLPISFGFTVRKRLNDRIGVESGLIYTYLSTRFRQTGRYNTEVRSNLHYLGIPLNLIVNLWDHPRWNIYFSAGMMVEKGIQAVYNQRKTSVDQMDNRTVKEGIRGLQWSANASVGAAYRVYRDWSLYLEPRFSYYFDSDQPVSIRTDKPLGFGLNAGVRFEF